MKNHFEIIKIKAPAFSSLIFNEESQVSSFFVAAFLMEISLRRGTLEEKIHQMSSN